MSLETTVLIPAGMKPMHGGHLHLIKQYVNNPDVKEVRVIIGPASREKIDQRLSIDIAKFLTKNIEKVTIVETSHPTPVTSLYKYMETVECGNYAVGAAYKSNDYKTVLKFVENFNKGGKYENTLPECVRAIELNIDFNPLLYKGRSDRYNELPICASAVRNDIDNNDLESFLTSYPETSLGEAIHVWNMIQSKLGKSKNLHMDHIEDLMFNSGIEGVVKCQKLFTNLVNTLTKKEEQVTITTKYDGSPAVFCWSSFPGLKNNGIALKGLFNINPLVMYTYTDIHVTNYASELKYKLRMLLNQVENLNIPEGQIWQGDFMYDDNTLKEEIINDKNYLSFHPNTIYYGIDESFKDYELIKKSKIGIAWHTIYEGDSLLNAKCRYNVDKNLLKQTEDLYSFDIRISYDDINKADLSFTTDLYYIDSLGYFINNTKYKNLLENKEFVENLTLFYNDLIRKCSIIRSTKFIEKFRLFLINRYRLIIESKKTQNCKDKYQNKLDEILNVLDEHSILITYMHRVINKLTGIKIGLIHILNEHSKIDTFFKLISGNFNKTFHEGYAINDGYYIAKLVNRHEFSSTNFSDEFVLKGWNSEKRATKTT